TTIGALFRCVLGSRSLATLAAACVLIGTASLAVGQQSFKTPEDAVEALFAAAKSGDNNAALTVFGPEGARIISSGDPVNDVNQRDKFVAAYNAKHQIDTKGDDKAMLTIGEHDWPFPVPLIKKSKGWQFDTSAGLEEILVR